MHRMKERVDRALSCYCLEDWTRQLAKRQFHFATKIAHQQGWPQAVLIWHPTSNWTCNFSQRPMRRAGRPLQRWDAKLDRFAKEYFPQHGTWIRAAQCPEWPSLAPNFLDFYVDS